MCQLHARGKKIVACLFLYLKPHCRILEREAKRIWFLYGANDIKEARTLVIMSKGEVIADKVRVADTFVTKFKGLMLKENLADGEGLLLKRCRIIHSCFMRVPIDVIYLSADNEILYSETVKPWRMGKSIKGVVNILELPEGYIEKIETGEVLELTKGREY